MYNLTKEQKLKFILEEVEKLGVSAYEISKNTNLTDAGVGRILNGTVKNPHENSLNAIIDYLEKKVLGSNLKENNTQNIISEPSQDYLSVSPNEVSEIEDEIIARERIIQLNPKQKELQNQIIKLLRVQIDLIKNNQNIIDK